MTVDNDIFINYLKDVSKNDEFYLLVDTISLDKILFNIEKSNKI